MEGWMQRLFTTLVLAVVTLLVAFLALALGMDWRAVALIALVLFASMVTVQLVVEMRRDVKLLKNQALELSGYESEIGRRVDYLASLVERSGGAAPDEIAKRVRAVNHQYAALRAELGARLDRIEEDVAEIAIMQPSAFRPGARASSPRPAPTVAGPVPVTRAPASARPRAAVDEEPTPPRQAQAATARPASGSASQPVSGSASEEGRTVASERRPAAVIPMPRPGTRKPVPEPDRNASHAWRERIGGDRLAFHLMPILSLPERGPVLYEAVMRLREDGDGVSPGWMEQAALLDALEPHGLASLVERKTLYTAARMLRTVRRMGKAMRLVAPLGTASLETERGFGEMRSFLESAPDLRDALVLEISQRSFRGLASEARQRVGLVADAGFQLSMGRLVDTNLQPATLRQLGFALVRARADLLVAPGIDTTTMAVALASHRIDLAATDVSDESVLPALLDRDVTMAQGPALANPRLVKPELLQAGPDATPPPVTHSATTPSAVTPATTAPSAAAAAS